MPKFSPASLARLSTCDERLQLLFHEVVKRVDCTIICGHRSQSQQDAAFLASMSKVRWPNSKHNLFPSIAVDVTPYPVEWPHVQMGREELIRAYGRFYMFVGYVRAVAFDLKIPIRCGADWDGDFIVKDQNFHDLPHFELLE